MINQPTTVSLIIGSRDLEYGPQNMNGTEVEMLEICSIFLSPGSSIGGSGRQEQDTHIQSRCSLVTSNIELTHGLLYLTRCVKLQACMSESYILSRLVPAS